MHLAPLVLMKRRANAPIWLAAVLAVWCVGTVAWAAGTPSSPSSTLQQRLAAIHHAQVWKKTNVAAMDLRAGPPGASAFTPGQEVSCQFLQRPHGKGSTPKFACTTANGDELKVRYGKTNGEVYAQVAATRLLWALGFYANRMYPVKVTCKGCSADPFTETHAAATSTTFDPATIDVKLDGETIETKPDEGWSWDELDQVDE